MHRFQTQACEQYLYGTQESGSWHVRKKVGVNSAGREMVPPKEKCE